jgi:hypothetical protein
METMSHDLAKRAMEETLTRLPFKNVLVLSDQDFLPGSTFVKIKHGNMEQYCNILLKQLPQHINTSHMIFQQWDAMVHDGSQWACTDVEPLGKKDPHELANMYVFKCMYVCVCLEYICT